MNTTAFSTVHDVPIGASQTNVQKSARPLAAFARGHTRCRHRASVPLAILVALAVALAAPSTAQARYYLSRGAAQSFMRDHLHQIGYTNTGVYCRPQGRRAPEPGYDYHRWSCSWIVNYERGVGYDCEGSTLISGSRRAGGYYFRDDEAHGDACIEYH